MRKPYKIDGEEYHHVTDIIDEIWAKKALRYWYAKMGMEGVKKELKRTAGIGLGVHKKIAHYLRTGENTWQDSMLKKPLDNWLEWWDKQGFEIEAIEEQVHHQGEFWYAGTLDFLGRRKGKRVFIDWKTSKATYPSHILQNAAYVKAWHYRRGWGVPVEAWIVRIPRDGGEIDDSTRRAGNQINSDIKTFEALYKCWEWKKKLK